MVKKAKASAHGKRLRKEEPERTHPGDHGEFRSGGTIKKSYIAGTTFGLKEIVYTSMNGQAMFEGDIVLGSDEELEEAKQRVENPPSDLVSAVVVAGTQFRWPQGVIPFRIDPNLTDQARVTDAIAHWQANTNVRLIQRTNQRDFVTFRPGGECSSRVGMRGAEQFITLDTGCTTGSVIHEIGHAAGLWHEQSREDRDTFITIHWDNIQANNRHNFDQHITDGDDIWDYDYDSIMHYPRTAFAIDPSKDTITPIPDPNRQIGQRNQLSAGDIVAINAIYPRKSTLGDTSNNGPALTARASQALLGWTGTGNLRLNFMSSVDGLNFSNKVTLGDTSPAALALTVFNNRFVVAWIGVGNNKLNIMQSNNGLNWSNKVTLRDTSLSAPALAIFANELCLAWRGVGNNKLNVMRSADGTTWENKVTLNETTLFGPSLAPLNRSLLLGWAGIGNNQLNIMQTSNGSNFVNKVTLRDTTVAKPHLHSDGRRAVLTWQGVGNRFLNVLTSTDGLTWRHKFISNETCIDGPVLTTLGAQLVWGWTGTDLSRRLNTLLFNIP